MNIKILFIIFSLFIPGQTIASFQILFHDDLAQKSSAIPSMDYSCTIFIRYDDVQQNKFVISSNQMRKSDAPVYMSFSIPEMVVVQMTYNQSQKSQTLENILCVENTDTCRLLMTYLTLENYNKLEFQPKKKTEYNGDKLCLKIHARGPDEAVFIEANPPQRSYKKL